MISRGIKIARTYKNKHEWRYKFIFRNSYFHKKQIYTITTDMGLQSAKYYANNNRLWDAFEDMEYVGREKIGGRNETISKFS
tara:strand:+ start:2888 stop:3133 length:246 start_codon:yes stop_codon:yes gene_type:complete